MAIAMFSELPKLIEIEANADVQSAGCKMCHVGATRATEIPGRRSQPS